MVYITSWDEFYEKAKSFFGNSEDGNNDSNINKNKKRCYYDLLEVDKNSNDDEIKRAFKKLALKWHPDKNPDRQEECAAYFILIQQAYEVLIDPHERAFYDRHRENILNRSDGSEVDETKDTGVDVRPFMKTSAWEGMFNMKTDDEQTEKFCQVYRELFHNISAEEYAYIEDIEERNFPVFGKTDSDFETIVAPFYAFWSDFSTYRSFDWRDKWDLRDAPDRPTARAMEKDNRKLRELGKRQRNDEIRALVAFVRKHDKRVGCQKEFLRRKAEEQRKKAEETRLQAIRRNLESVQLELDEFDVNEDERLQHLANLEEIENELDAEFGTVMDERKGSSVDDEDDDSDNYCIVCEKAFKNSKSFQNHQRSKKHLQAVEELRNHMKEEDQSLFANDYSVTNDIEADQEDKKPKRKKKKNKKEKDTQLGNSSKNAENYELEQTEIKKEKECQLEKSTNENANDEHGSEQTETEFRDKLDESMNKNEAKNTDIQKGKKSSKHQKTSLKQQKSKQAEQDMLSHNSEPIVSRCQTCDEEFSSRSKLFSHLKESGHATLKTSNIFSKPNSNARRKK